MIRTLTSIEAESNLFVLALWIIQFLFPAMVRPGFETIARPQGKPYAKPCRDRSIETGSQLAIALIPWNYSKNQTSSAFRI